jgi:hypothetical protein
VAAVDVARAALLESVEPGDVGEHLGHQGEGERVVSHSFDCTRRGYRGWRWSVVLTRAPRQKAVTVDEVVLLPGPEAVVAPEWVPYRDRVQPDDLGPGDLLIPDEDDPRLVPGWFVGDGGPDSALAKAAPGLCRECGFLVRLAGPLATVFGVCANGQAPDDGRVVALDHGCGGFSETTLKVTQQPPVMPPHVFDTVARDDIEIF